MNVFLKVNGQIVEATSVTVNEVVGYKGLESYDSNGIGTLIDTFYPESEVEVLSSKIEGELTVLTPELKMNNGHIIVGDIDRNELIKLTAGIYKGFYTTFNNCTSLNNEIYLYKDLVFLNDAPFVNDGTFLVLENEAIQVTDQMKDILKFFKNEFVDFNVNKIMSTIRRSNSIAKINFGKHMGLYSSVENIVALPNGDKVHSSESFIVKNDVKVGLTNIPDRYGYGFDKINSSYELLSDMVKVVTRSHGEIYSLKKDTFIFSRSLNKYFLNSEEASQMGYIFCQRCQDWEDADHHKPQLAGYHSGLGRKNHIGESRFGIGIEAEKEDNSVKSFINYKDILTRTGWIVERDGSLDSSGFEAVSPALPLDHTKSIYEQTEWIEKYITPVEDLLNAKYSSRCGGHAHISSKNHSPSELLDAISGYLPLLYSIYNGRYKQRWSQALKKDDYKSSRGSHSVAMNITSKTLELRIFPAVESVQNLLWRIELIRIMVSDMTSDYKQAFKNCFINHEHPMFQHLSTLFNEEKMLIKSKLFSSIAQEIDQLIVSPESLLEAEEAIKKAKGI